MRCVLYPALVLGLLACSSGKSSEPGQVSHLPTEVPSGIESLGDAIEHSLSLDDARHHYLRVRSVFPAPAGTEVELSMAVWTPGSYLVREYARHIEELRFVDASGALLSATKISKNRWKVRTGAKPGLVAEYNLYARELSVRTNFVDADALVLNGAASFLRLVEDGEREHTVKLELPEGWKPAISALDSAGASNYFKAKSYDELLDSPILAGRELHSTPLEVEGVPHHLVHLGDSSQWDLEEVALDVQLLARAHARFWGVIPYEHYHFLNVLLGGGGGLEHLDSTLMMARPFSTRTGEGYRGWLGLVSHEFFHTWNVKRLRPKSLGPFDYENENYTRSLWIAEGITSYYDDLLLKRAGLLDQEQYLDKLSGMIRSLQTTPGRLVQTLSRASFDAWIKHYRRDENTGNTSVSYYTKGAVVAFLLDAEIRIATGAKKSLDDLMRLMYERYSGSEGYTPEQFRATASEVAGTDLGDFFRRALDSREELDYSRATAYYGFDLESAPKTDEGAAAADEEDGDEDEEDEPAGYLGADMSGDTVQSVERGTPAYEAGLNVGDEVLAIDGYRSGGGLGALLKSFRAGQEVTLTIARRGRLRELGAKLGESPEPLWTLKASSTRSALQKSRMDLWLAEYDL